MNDAQEEEREELPLAKAAQDPSSFSFSPTIQAQQNCRSGRVVYPRSRSISIQVSDPPFKLRKIAG
jgi:hypothetical protein